MSDGKDISLSSSFTDNNKKSLLPEDAQEILESGMIDGFEDECLSLRLK